MTRFVLVLVPLLLLIGSPSSAWAPQPPPSGGTGQIEGFVPVDELPQAEQLPAGRLVITAYAFVWLAVFVYIWSLWRRLGKIEADLQQLAKRTGVKPGP